MRSRSLVYILAASHSGSTLSALLLNSHPEICAAGELKATHLGDRDTYRCSCQNLIDDCYFWINVSSEMRKRGQEYFVGRTPNDLNSIPSEYVRRLLKPLHRGASIEMLRDVLLKMSPAWRTEIRSWRARNAALVESIATASGARYVVDSSKIALRLKYLQGIPGIDLKVIRLVRDGRAVALTYMRPSEFADATDPGLRGGGSGIENHNCLSMPEAANEWRRSNEEASEVLRSFPDESHIQLSYEELCMDPAATLARIFGFMGLAGKPHYEEFRSVEHHVVGNGMRLDSGSAITLDERWRTVLTATELADFEEVAGDLNRELGYQ